MRLYKNYLTSSTLNEEMNDIFLSEVLHNKKTGTYDIAVMADKNHFYNGDQIKAGGQ